MAASFVLLLLALDAAAARKPGPPAPTRVHVNRDPNEQLAAAGPLHVGWVLPPEFGGVQRSFWIRLEQKREERLAAEYECKPSREIANCSLSDNIPLEALTSQLPFGTSFRLSVRVADSSGALSAWSAPAHFATALEPGLWPGGAVPIWAANPLQKFVLLRRSFVGKQGEHLLHITAHSVPTRKKNAGANATKLLCAYKLWINGLPVSAGPGRPTGRGSTIQVPALLYDTVNITSMLRVGEANVIAIQSWYWTNEQEQSMIPTTITVHDDHDDRGGVLALLTAGGRVVAATGDPGWLAFNRGDDALLPALPPPGCKQCCPHSAQDAEAYCEFCTITGGRFQLMHEHWNVTALPIKWQLPGFTETSEWSAPRQRSVGFPRLEPKGARAIALVHHTPKAIRAVTPSGVGSFRCKASDALSPVCGWNASVVDLPQVHNSADSTYCYVIDMGTIIQGGINVTFSNGVAGTRVNVIASELMIGMNGRDTPTGAVQPNGTDDSVHYDQWTLAEGYQTVVSHEYIVARFWQVIGAPDPPTLEQVQGWKVWYPMTDPHTDDSRDDSRVGQTSIRSSSEQLDSVWELCRFTGRTGAMDVNTDSNARQRDNCNVDSHITAMHQAAAGPAASANYRRRNGFFLFQPDAKVHPWTEFKLFSLGAVHEYTLDTGDLALANETFDNLVEHYSLSKFIQTASEPVATAGLVVKSPMAGLPPGVSTQASDNKEYYAQVYEDLIDYPNVKDYFNDDTQFPEGERCCIDGYIFSNVSTVVNAHVAQAHRRLASMSRWLGRPAAEATYFQSLADGIVAGLKRAMVQGHACDPPAKACFLDGLGIPVRGYTFGRDPNETLPYLPNATNQIAHTSVQATLFVIGCGLLEPVTALTFLSFLKAKTKTMPLFSAMASNFFLEGLYTMAAADRTTAAADFAFEVLTRGGHRSWVEMLRHNATMTTEHWYGTYTGTNGGHTWSHPWSAAPARIIPQFLMGIRPLEPAWRRIAVHPQPGSTLTHAAMLVPTLRGEVRFSFERARDQFALNLSVPGNTIAEVCLPVGLLCKRPRVILDGATVMARTPPRRVGQLCLASDLVGGVHTIVIK